MFKKCFTNIIMAAMATYPKFFKSSPFFLIIIFKARIKKNSGMFKKCFAHIIMVAMATYFFSKFLCKFFFFKSSPFLEIIFNANKIYQECSRNVFGILSWFPWQHPPLIPILVKNEIVKIKPIFLNYF